MDVKELIVRYGLVFPKRFYPKEKLRFLRGLAQEFINAGMKVDIKEATKNQRKAYNLYVGDIRQSGLTISAYYDTPPKSFGLIKHNVYCPRTDGTEFLISILLPYAIIIAIAALYSNFVLMPLWTGTSYGFYAILALIPILLLLFLLMLFRNGIGNKPNLLRNSAALIACVKVVGDLKPKEKNKIGLAFTDFGCISHYGDDMLKGILGGNADKNTVILLDCVGGDGDVIVLYNRECVDYVEKVRAGIADKAVFYEMEGNKTHYYSLFPKSIVITSGKLENGAVVVSKANTSKDNDISEGNLSKSIDVLNVFIQNY